MPSMIVRTLLIAVWMFHTSCIDEQKNTRSHNASSDASSDEDLMRKLNALFDKGEDRDLTQSRLSLAGRGTCYGNDNPFLCCLTNGGSPTACVGPVGNYCSGENLPPASVAGCEAFEQCRLHAAPGDLAGCVENPQPTMSEPTPGPSQQPIPEPSQLPAPSQEPTPEAPACPRSCIQPDYAICVECGSWPTQAPNEDTIAHNERVIAYLACLNKKSECIIENNKLRIDYSNCVIARSNEVVHGCGNLSPSPSEAR